MVIWQGAALTELLENSGFFSEVQKELLSVHWGKGGQLEPRKCKINSTLINAHLKKTYSIKKIFLKANLKIFKKFELIF